VRQSERQFTEPADWNGQYKLHGVTLMLLVVVYLFERKRQTNPKHFKKSNRSFVRGVT
jgi:hypothetical protein